MSSEIKNGEKSLKIGSIQELCIIAFALLLGYQIFTMQGMAKGNDIFLRKIERMETTLAENNTFIKTEISSIKTDVNILKNKVVELESQQRFNNKQVANKTDDGSGINYYIEKAVFSDDEKVVLKKK